VTGDPPGEDPPRPPVRLARPLHRQGHRPFPGARHPLLWGYHDVQCQVPNPRPGPHLDSYPECSLIDRHSGDHDYRRHAAAAGGQP